MCVSVLTRSRFPPLSSLDQDASEFYAEHDGKPFYPGLVKQMTSDLCCVLVLRKVGAIAAWRALMGPTNPDAARAAAEAVNPLDDTNWSLRALFGTAGPKNATHGSDSPYSAQREINLFFPPTTNVWQRSLLVVTADAGGKVADITATLESDNFVVVASGAGTLTKAQAASITGGAGADADAIAHGPSTALVVEGFNATLRLALRAGPAVAIAKANNPSSLRALYGKSDAEPGVVVADVTSGLPLYFHAPLPLERTLAIVKPGVANAHGDSIARELAHSGFTILGEDRVTLSQAQASSLYAVHAEKPFFDTLIK